jgi:hypothetical protein
MGGPAGKIFPPTGATPDVPEASCADQPGAAGVMRTV